jgi:hypothetical protein
LPDLASRSDLSARGVEPDDDSVADVFLEVASAVVRKAAQSPIVQTTSTVDVWAQDSDRYLELPGKPVTAVSEVVLDGDTLAATDYRLIHGRLWRQCGWGCDSDPKKVTVTMTHGYLAAPEWVVQLVCDLAIAGMKAAPGGARDPRVFVESLGPYSVTWSQLGAASQVATAMELPSATKLALRRAFGGSASLVASR